MAFPINSHAGEEVKRFRIEENRGKMQKEKENKISKVEALQNCDCGSFLSTFLLLVLCTAQRSVGFFLRVGCNLCTLVGSL